MNISVLGHGAWGSALAIHLSQQHKVTLWGRDSNAIQNMRESHVNETYLPGITLPTALKLSDDLLNTINETDLILVATPIAAPISAAPKKLNFFAIKHPPHIEN